MSRLEAMLRVQPDRHQAKLALGQIERLRGNARAENLLLETIEAAEQKRDMAGQVRGRLALASFLARRGRMTEADANLEAGRTAAEASGEPLLVAGALAELGIQAKRRGDYGRSRGLLQQAEAIAFPDGPLRLQISILSGLGGVAQNLGLYRQAIDDYTRQVELSRQLGDLRSESSARFNIALIHDRLMNRGLVGPLETEARVREALDSAIRARNLRVEARSRLLLGELIRGPQALEQFEVALRSSEEIGNVPLQLWATREIAREKIRQGSAHHAEGFKLFQQAIDRSRATGDRVEIARSVIARAFHAAVVDRPRDEWISWYLEALEEIEKIRDLQPEDLVRARTFSRWVQSYYALSAFLLDRLAISPNPDQDLELAFRTLERMRSRLLLDILDAAQGSGVDTAVHPLHDARRIVLERIAKVQSEGMERAPDAERSNAAQVELDRLEAEEANLRDRLAREDPRFGALRVPEIPTLDSLRATLEPHQAMLLFQLANRPDRRDYPEHADFSWLLMVTRDGVETFALPERQVLEQQIEVFQGLFEEREGSETAVAHVLYDELLGQPLSRMPESITQLVIVLDGPLFQLPFAALREAPARAPLIADYTMTYVPSATLWMKWKQADRARVESQALILADPETGITEAGSKMRESAPWTEGLRLGRLPHARTEARVLLRAVGSGRVRSGAEASESFVKQADLGSFGIVHFAAHALTDDQRPLHSAIVLAPGAESEDGLLQVREIVDLDLDGCAVILSACSSASGTMLQGEGVMGLAHAFFRAGAHAVVGSLWPLRDDEAADLMQVFAEHLGAGLSVGSALGAAQLTMVERGAPAAAWAGVVVLGDGDTVPVSDASRPGSLRAWSWGLAIGAAALVLLGLFLSPAFRRRRRK